jgi:hypothetical protein
MTTLIANILNKLRENRFRLFITVTGGGTGVIPALLDNGGAGDVFVGAEVPYSYTVKPFGRADSEKLVSAHYAESLAECSYDNVGLDEYGSEDSLAIGLGVTASLMKNGERAERINEAWMALTVEGKNCEKFTLTRHVPLDKMSIRNRLEQEGYLVVQILHFLNDFLTGAIL